VLRRATPETVAAALGLTYRAVDAIPAARSASGRTDEIRGAVALRGHEARRNSAPTRFRVVFGEDSRRAGGRWLAPKRPGDRGGRAMEVAAAESSGVHLE
jgi:hypothetical protein